MEEDVINWLNEIGEVKVANLMKHCTIETHYVDSAFSIDSDDSIDLFYVIVRVPGKFYKKVRDNVNNVASIIESNVWEVLQAQGIYLKGFSFEPLIISSSIENPEQKISIVTRQAIFDEIILSNISWCGTLDEPHFLNRVFDLKKLPSFDNRFNNAFDDINKHTVLNNDWEHHWVFTDRRFNLLHCDEKILLNFLALTIHPLTRRDKEDYDKLISILNKYLARDGYKVFVEKTIQDKNIYGFITTEQIKDTPKLAATAVEPIKKINERRLALVVGVSNYAFVGQLANPLNDANAVKRELEKCGFDVMLVIDPELRQLKESIDNFGVELSKYNTGLFYFAGHGVQVKGLNYLIPIDADLKAERVVEYDCVRVDRVLTHMEESKCEVNIIILDACRNNPFERSWGRSMQQRGLANMDAPKGSLIAYSTSPGKTASDGEKDNGLYTGELIQQIYHEGITITQMFQIIRKEVMNKSKEQQIPWESTSLTSDFYFVK